VALRGRAFSTASALPKVVLVDGCRLPFQMSGTGYSELIAQDLGRMALRGLLDRNPQLNPGEIDQVLMGTVIQ